MSANRNLSRYVGFRKFYLILSSLFISFGSYGQSKGVDQCIPDTLGVPDEIFSGIDKEASIRYVLKIYSNGGYSLDWQDISGIEIVKNVCVGQYQERHSQIYFQLECEGFDATDKVNKLRRSRKGLKVKSGDFKVFHNILIFVQ
jgi:hypothetical protein